MADLNLWISEANESYNILRVLRDRVIKNQDEAVEAFQNGVIQNSLIAIRELSVEDKVCSFLFL